MFRRASLPGELAQIVKGLVRRLQARLGEFLELDDGVRDTSRTELCGDFIPLLVKAADPGLRLDLYMNL
jgi:hypothetical protein